MSAYTVETSVFVFILLCYSTYTPKVKKSPTLESFVISAYHAYVISLSTYLAKNKRDLTAETKLYRAFIYSAI